MKLYLQYGALIAVLSQIYFAPHENFVAPLSLGLVLLGITIRDELIKKPVMLAAIAGVFAAVLRLIMMLYSGNNSDVISVILDSLRKKPVDITAIVTVADDGGSSGELRRNIQKLTPPGDLRNVLVAMSDMPRFYEKVFQYRFADDDGPLAGHPLGNLIIAGISEMQGSTYNAMQLLTKFFHTTGKIYPSSDSPLTLHAVFQDGKEVVGESHIANYTGMIDHVYVTNTFDQERPKASKKVVEAILESDMVVLGPGSLFTSILPNLMIDEIGKAILETKAQVAYVCNIMTQRGETEHFTDSDHVAVLHKHLGQKLIS